MLTAHVKQHPASIVLLEDIEKGHAKILQALLEPMSDGTLIDAKV